MMGTDPAVVDRARRSMLELALAMESDEDLIAFARKGFGIEGMLEPASARDMFAAASMKWLTVSIPVVARYRCLLADHPDDEPTFQRFFSEHPEMLDPMVVDVWAHPDLHWARKPDFVLRRSDGSYLVVEFPVERDVVADVIEAVRYGKIPQRLAEAAEQSRPVLRPAEPCARVGDGDQHGGELQCRTIPGKDALTGLE